MKRWLIAIAVTVALLGGIFTVGAILLTRPTSHTEAVQSTIEPITVQGLHEAVNAKRRETGVPELVLDERLNQSAQAKATDMDVDGYYSHIDPVTGKYGYEYIREIAQCYGSENLQTGASDSEHTVIGWMQSTGHREAILNQKYTRVGYSVVGEYVVQHLC